MTFTIYVNYQGKFNNHNLIRYNNYWLIHEAQALNNKQLLQKNSISFVEKSFQNLFYLGTNHNATD